MVNVVECVYSLAKKAEDKGFPIKLQETLPSEQGYSDAEIKTKLSSADVANIKEQLSKLREERKETNRPKVSAEIFRRKLALLLGNKVDCKYSFKHN